MPIETVSPIGGLRIIARGVGAEGEAFPPAFDEMTTTDLRFEKQADLTGNATTNARLAVAVATYDLRSLADLDITILSAQWLWSISSSNYFFTRLSAGSGTLYGSDVHELAAEWLDDPHIYYRGSEIYGADDSAQDAMGIYDLAQHTDTGDSGGVRQFAEFSVPVLNAAEHIVNQCFATIRLVCVGTPVERTDEGITWVDGMWVRAAPALEVEYEEGAGGGGAPPGEELPPGEQVTPPETPETEEDITLPQFADDLLAVRHYPGYEFAARIRRVGLRRRAL